MPETLIAFALTWLVVSLIPGPSVLMVVAQSLANGPRAAMACIVGDLAAGVVIMTVSALGMGMILAASATAFTVIKWLGVAYLVWLGVSQIRAARAITPHALEQAAPPASRGLRAGFVTGLFNPKAIVFYMAFLSPFIDPAAPLAPQLLALMAVSSAIVALVLGAYAALAVWARRYLSGATAKRRAGYVGGSVMLGGGLVMAVTR